MTTKFITLKDNNENLLYPVTDYSCIKNAPDIVTLPPENFKHLLTDCILSVAGTHEPKTLFFNCISYNYFCSVLEEIQYSLNQGTIQIASNLSYSGHIAQINVSQYHESGDIYHLTAASNKYIPDISDMIATVDLNPSDDSGPLLGFAQLYYFYEVSPAL